MIIRPETKSTDDSFQRDWDEFKSTTEQAQQASISSFLKVNKLQAQLEEARKEADCAAEKWESLIREGRMRVEGDEEEAKFSGSDQVRGEIELLNKSRLLFLGDQRKQLVALKKLPEEVVVEPEIIASEPVKKSAWSLSSIWGYLPALPRKSSQSDGVVQKTVSKV